MNWKFSNDFSISGKPFDVSSKRENETKSHFILPVLLGSKSLTTEKFCCIITKQQKECFRESPLVTSMEMVI